MNTFLPYVHANDRKTGSPNKNCEYALKHGAKSSSIIVSKRRGTVAPFLDFIDGTLPPQNNVGFLNQADFLSKEHYSSGTERSL